MGGLTAVAGFGGATAGLGLLLTVAGWRGLGADRIRPTSASSRLTRWVRSLSWQQAAAIVGLPLLALAVTGWPVLAGWALAAAVLLPRLFGHRRDGIRRLERLAAVADWTRRLASVLTAGAGLEQAITATVHTAPAVIADDISRLAAGNPPPPHCGHSLTTSMTRPAIWSSPPSFWRRTAEAGA
jgi:tight adherence protein B